MRFKCPNCGKDFGRNMTLFEWHLACNAKCSKKANQLKEAEKQLKEVKKK